jgi:hypothetical protein
MHSKEQRKEAIRQFKEQKVARGAYAIRCRATGQVWVGLSPNLKAKQNSSWFGLRMGSHIDKGLQTEWNTHGESAFTFEVLEELDENVAALNLRDELKSVRERWAARLSAKTLL